MMNNSEMLKKFIEFKNGFTGDAKAEVMKLVQSGQITQEQLNRVQEQANMFQRLISGK